MVRRINQHKIIKLRFQSKIQGLKLSKNKDKNGVKIDKQIKENKKPDIKKEIKPRKEVRGLTTFYSYSDVDTTMLDFDELFS